MVSTIKEHIRRMDVQIVSDQTRLRGRLSLPRDPEGLIIWVRDAENTRLRSRDQVFVEAFQKAGFATLLLDLLSESERRIDLSTLRLGTHVPFLAGRIQLGIEWALTNDSTRHLNLGLFGTETGGAAVLVASIQRSHRIRAIVCEEGRPDLRGSILADIKVPTLFITGDWDVATLENNQEAAKRLTVENKLVTIAGTGRLVRPSKKLNTVVEHAKNWFREHMN
jgi:pimeloyl-ACP methyl ester carboxylesterase